MVVVSLKSKENVMKMVREDFPIFSQKSEKPLVYFDNAATTQKPRAVLSTLSHFYMTYNASINRGLYKIAERTTEMYESVRYKVARFINAQSSSEIIFTSGTTDSINTVALIWGQHIIKKGDEIVISMMEHHSNFVPWQQLALAKKAILKIIPVTKEGLLDLSDLNSIITEKTKLVAVTHISNALGIRNDLAPIIKRAKEVKARVLIDGAQSVAFEKVDVQELCCDFYVFSSHKMCGPTGVGVLYINRLVQKECKPYKTGGGMVHEVSVEKTTFLPAPMKFEAGTPAIAQVIGFGAAIDYIFRHSFEEIQAHAISLTSKLIDGLEKLPKVRILGSVAQLKVTGHIVSFVVEGMHAHDVAAYLDKEGICVRAGHHCAQPLATALGYQSSVRVSFYSYNTVEEVEYFLKVMRQLLPA